MHGGTDATSHFSTIVAYVFFLFAIGGFPWPPNVDPGERKTRAVHKRGNSTPAKSLKQDIQQPPTKQGLAKAKKAKPPFFVCCKLGVGPNHTRKICPRSEELTRWRSHPSEADLEASGERASAREVGRTRWRLPETWVPSSSVAVWLFFVGFLGFFLFFVGFLSGIFVFRGVP